MNYKILTILILPLFILTSCTHLLYKDLVPAAEYGHLDSVRYHILKNPKRINEKDKEGEGLLFLAAKSGNLSVVEFLVEQGADINEADKEGRTPLMAAASMGYYSITKHLVYNGAEINAAKRDGWNALMFAIQYGHEDVVDFLKDNDATAPDWVRESKEARLIYSCEIGDLGEVQDLIKEGVDVNAFYVNTRNTALMKASEYDHKQIVKYLIKKGANRDMKNREGKTALMIARDRGNKKVAKILMRR